MGVTILAAELRELETPHSKATQQRRLSLRHGGLLLTRTYPHDAAHTSEPIELSEGAMRTQETGSGLWICDFSVTDHGDESARVRVQVRLR